MALSGTMPRPTSLETMKIRAFAPAMTDASRSKASSISRSAIIRLVTHSVRQSMRMAFSSKSSGDRAGEFDRRLDGRPFRPAPALVLADALAHLRVPSLSCGDIVKQQAALPRQPFGQCGLARAGAAKDECAARHRAAPDGAFKTCAKTTSVLRALQFNGEWQVSWLTAPDQDAWILIIGGPRLPGIIAHLERRTIRRKRGVRPRLFKTCMPVAFRALPKLAPLRLSDLRDGSTSPFYSRGVGCDWKSA